MSPFSCASSIKSISTTPSQSILVFSFDSFAFDYSLDEDFGLVRASSSGYGIESHKLYAYVALVVFAKVTNGTSLLRFQTLHWMRNCVRHFRAADNVSLCMLFSLKS